MDEPFLTIYETPLDPQTSGIARDWRLDWDRDRDSEPRGSRGREENLRDSPGT